MTDKQMSEIRDDLQALIDSVGEGLEATYHDNTTAAQESLFTALGAAMILAARLDVADEITYGGKPLNRAAA